MRTTFRDETDPQFWGLHFARKPQVSIDGEVCHGVIEADEEEGFAMVLEPIDGRFVAGPDDLITIKREGKVKISGDRL